MALHYSIIIPFYDGFPYVRQCVESILAQGVDSLEVIIVDDCDPAYSGRKFDAIYSEEPHVKIIHHEHNLGTLQARRTGVLASTGERVMFMDQDDVLMPGALAALQTELASNSVDILHFAAHVVAENADAENAREGMQSYLTPPVRTLSGEEILNYQFSQTDGFDWQVTHKVYDGELARKAWFMLGDMKLSRADDVYASFVVCSLAKSYRAIDGCWYEYHLGRGDTFGSKNTGHVGRAGHVECNENAKHAEHTEHVIDSESALENFKRWCDSDASAYNAVRTFAHTQGSSLNRANFDEPVANVCELMAAHSMNGFIDTLDVSEWEDAISYVSQLWPASVIAAELWRFVRDRSYALLDSGDPITNADVLFPLLKYAKHFDSQVEGECSKRYYEHRSKAFEHTLDLERKTGAVLVDEPTLIKEASYEAQPLRIFVTTHKDVATFQSDILQPVQVGSADSRKRFLWAYQDDKGDNIANTNTMFCELTTQYWAWKNTRAKYYGFCHYRRYFNFSGEEYVEDPWGEIVDSRINALTQARYGLDDKSITAAIEGWDIVTTKIQDLREFPEKYESVYDHYKRAPYLKVEHIDSIISILEEEQPDYASDAKAYLEGSKTCFCNMFVMSEALFDRYCSWLFPLLERFDAQWDTSRLSKEALRTPGHIAERLFNIWLLHEKRTNPNLRHKELQCVRFEHPEPYCAPVLAPAPDAEKPTVPVVFAANDNYVPMLTTAIYSMLENASPSYFYDIVILESGISEANKNEMQSFFTSFANASLRFAYIDGMVDQYRLKTSSVHISVETYYRFLAQRVLPDYNKVIYLDSDLVVLGDISELWNVELGSNLVAAVIDADYLGNLNKNDGVRMRYTLEVLHMNNPYGYFQAGVLVMNLEQMRKIDSFEQWLARVSESKLLYDDQDILNMCCEGRVVYLDNAWNVMNNCADRISSVCSFAPANVYEKYLEAYKNPKILHFAGFEKPWKPGGCDKEMLYWDYAKKTPFYEQQIAAMLKTLATASKASEVELKQARAEINRAWAEINQIVIALDHEPVLSEDNKLRKVLDPLFPMGTRRREVMKNIGRFFSGKK